MLAAQTALAKLGYPVKADGEEGSATQQAIRDFERAHGLPPVDGDHAGAGAGNSATAARAGGDDDALRLRSDIWVAAFPAPMRGGRRATPSFGGAARRRRARSSSRSIG